MQSKTTAFLAGFSLTALFFFATPALAIPEFARTYDLSCSSCHSAFPRLNAFGENFADNNFRLPNWRDKTLDTGDERLALPDHAPFAVRAQAYVQARTAESINTITGERVEADTDFQSPYLVKLLSSAPLSEHITYYFYAILAEKGENGEALVEDAWFRHDDIFCTEVGLQLGQFQVSDLMFPRETRLTFQDYIVYRMARITYERGVLFDRKFGPVDAALGVVNGNGITESFNINSPGYRRPDRLFDNDNSKSVFGRLGAEFGPVSAGLFGLSGQQPNAEGPAGLDVGERDTDMDIIGVDLSGYIGNDTGWFVQYLWNNWDGFLEPGRDYNWHGGFLGLDYTPDGPWAFSLLYNRTDASDFSDTDTIYKGIEMNTLTFTASYYFMRNIKGVIELNIDFQGKDSPDGDFFVGHLDKENYFLLGFDAAF